ncbi:unnamed protein product [Mytilus edulis]|uniref:C-type lectin domain-containing protein n=1 Tax=Mytilus edulis TaxID=6550 RepID=A0A8S3QFY3_MYTED|nr:unnamed protein product [Mytilus edulis]
MRKNILPQKLNGWWLDIKSNKTMTRLENKSILGSSGTLGLLVKLAILQSLLMSPSLTTGAGAGCPAVTCPAGYMKLDDQRISPNCYFFGGRNDARSWHSADVYIRYFFLMILAVCTSTSGAHLLVPDSLAEIEALRRKFGIGDNDGDVWTGANLRSSGNFMFKVNMVNNKNFDFNALPFGVENESGMRGSPSCIEIELNSNGVACTETENYICELPVVSKNIALKVHYVLLDISDAHTFPG